MFCPGIKAAISYRGQSCSTFPTIILSAGCLAVFPGIMKSRFVEAQLDAKRVGQHQKSRFVEAQLDAKRVGQHQKSLFVEAQLDAKRVGNIIIRGL